MEGWTTAAYDDGKWKNAVVVPLQGTAFSGTEGGRGGAPGTPFNYDKLSLVGQIGNNAGVFRTLTAKSVKEVRPGVYVYNMGQNMVGVPRITIANGRAGGRITLRYSEMLYPDLKESGKNVGMIMTENYRAALSQDVYTMKAGSQVFQPRFTSHGYQYVEITGIDKPLPLEAVQGVAISSVRELTADYKTSSEKVNRLWSNLVWSNVDNFLTIPTDCPQRNERMGWSGDINVFSRTATYVSNADQFLTRHMYAMRDVQARVRQVHGCRAGRRRLRRRPLGQRGNCRSVGNLSAVQRRRSAGAALSGDGRLHRLSRDHHRSEDGLEFGRAVGRLAGAAEQCAGNGLPRDRISRVRSRHHGEGGCRYLGKSGDAAKYTAACTKSGRPSSMRPSSTRKEDAGTRRARRGGGRGASASAAPEFRLADTQTSYAVGLAMDLFNRARTCPSMVRNLADDRVSGKQRRRWESARSTR